MKSNTKKLTMAAFFVAIAVVFSFVNIPVGLAKCYPIQHMVNVLSAVLLGPLYSVLVAFCTSLIRNMSGTGSLMAFPGSMIGAFFAGFLFYKTKKLSLAFLGEVIGTGLIGALLAYPIAKFVLGKEMALFGMVIPFSVSTLGGSIIAIIIILSIKNTELNKYFNL
ncbi:MAG: energy coupling factor transporter S component ThiW [Peptoniphilus harei]|uniref:energy coupling factor transporter S component ThiW n=1 Tax=Peptoniphilus harei TaxID=54005 RepID=UPI0025515D8D|nr:energy coupling factor transporter S component ThiW [Peptoniphilus harei]MDK7755840.1 energy coupling factor transporter S component ThiW [Peptoniphilus harei]MDK7761368.1 energy coupling factor transporter S component ThiW [Peptoniphilus harei]MDK8271189.1 energy coupling factor transporter S component ThiW [Peptoniphilus harei]MDK8339673.1 energy coupling factor transporter S component ThiW [Peptoniphilus harei]